MTIIMTIIDPALGAKLVYILGFTNIVAILLVFFSCRCLVGTKFVKRMGRYKWYQGFYRQHCFFWWLFIASVLLHTLVGFLVFGNPFG